MREKKKSWWVYSLNADYLLHTKKPRSQNDVRNLAKLHGVEASYGPLKQMLWTRDKKVFDRKFKGEEVSRG